ncbi:pitrilysin family protein [Brasilonema sp. UFV-L1]|uniref:M16 family metallopeptidase n=1 Tax=Brasilonema sp. UFV-L1 TaxID=2234130 RepID=UPI00145DF7E3|nr:pitrilysin family protein [Brasilonema sp. UFV-L1]NMG11515.1 insulinase family protein [Brasilonema sp. UFV-L1]
MTVLLLGDEFSYSQITTSSLWSNSHQIIVSKKAEPYSLTENVHKTILDNGLTVLTQEIHSSPVVTVQVWYKVGSRNEEPGLNGIAHQLEHMMFKGTKNRPIQFGRLLSALGSDSNAFTSYDQTAYYNTAERGKLKALLTLEADRMQNARIDATELASEKRVVISELQGYENSPDYRLNTAVMLSAFPNHAYGLPIGGTKADVERFNLEQVEKYYRNFYSPDNAVLVIVGDFQTESTLEATKEIFGKIPKTQKSGVRSQESGGGSAVDGFHRLQQLPFRSQESGRTNPIVLREPGAGALLQAVYPLPDVNHPDVPALDLMDRILTDGRNSRLEQALIESGLASDVSAAAVNLIELGWYELLITADPEQDLKKIDSVLKSAIAKLINKGVTTEELNRAKMKLEASVLLSNRDLTSLGLQLGNDETTTGDYRYTERYLTAIRQVTMQDVQRVAKKYLKHEARIVGFFEPTQITVEGNDAKVNSKRNTENFTSSSGGSVTTQEVKKYLPPVDLASIPTNHTLPEQFTLPNGLRILLVPDTSTPTVTLSGYVKAGLEFDPEDKAGLASVVAENLMNGTKTKDALTVAKILEDRGASLEFETYREGVQIQGDSLAADLPVLIQTLADVVKNANFPTKDFKLSLKQALTALKQELDDPSDVARRTFVQSVYPKKHPLHIFPTEQSLRRISRKDVIEFKTKHYRPDTTVLALVGDFTPESVQELIKTEFGNWKANGVPPTLKYPAVSLPEKVIDVNPVLPGKAQAITYMGNTGINRKDSRFYAALVLNQILGGDTLSSRLGAQVRDRLGLTYGIYSSFLTGKNSGTFMIEMQTSPEDTRQAIASTRELLKEIHQKGVTELEVETAKHILISNYIVSLANPEELIDKILMNEVYGLAKEELRGFPEKIQAVNFEQVNQAARELLYPDKIVVVTAGPPVVAEQGRISQ